MSRFALIFTAAVLLSNSSIASEYLEPEDSAFTGFAFDTEYQARVTTVMHEAFARDVLVRMIGEPSFSPEYVLGVRKDTNGYVLFGMTPKIQLWLYSTLHDLKEGSIQCVKTDKTDCNGPKSRSLRRHCRKTGTI